MSTTTEIENTASGRLAKLALRHLPEPVSFDQQDVVTNAAKSGVFVSLEAAFENREIPAVIVQVSGPAEVKGYALYTNPDGLRVPVYGLEPTGPVYKIESWTDLLDKQGPVRRVWLSPTLATEIVEERERRKRFEKRDKEYIRIAG